MSKTFRAWHVDEVWLFPPSVQDFVPAKHMAHFVRETVRTELDLGAIFACYGEERGYPPYHPAMMVALLLYGYSRGIYSSRQLARACEERVDFMAVTGMSRPDFRTTAEFRRRHLKALGDLFVQVLRLCRQAGLVKLGHVALDGTKIKANASKHKAMSYGRMRAAEAKLEAEVNAWFARAAAADSEEDRAHGTARGDELPDWVADKQQRLERLRQAKAALEAEAKAPPSDDDGPGPSTGMMEHGRPKRAPDGGPPDRAQRNFTDPDSRILPTRDGVIQGYNAQIAVDGAHQIILAQRVQTNAADRGALVPLVKAIRHDLRAKPAELSADAAYCDEANLAFLARGRIAAYLAPGRARHAGGDPAGKRRMRQRSRVAAMATKLRRAGRRSRYRLRKQIVEPVFGQIKAPRSFRQFLLRGLDKVRGEWAMICTAHNLLKLAAATA
ncbi:MAG TPA: IS1182 family transposase [Xanthobacteraceae bacterium]|nr:IS1182 family transposase [Xanthobacteraceae bacterium]